MKALPWFRMYHEALDDEKLRLLACEDRWHFVALLCCKAKGILDDGGSLLRRKVAVKLGLSTNELDEVARRLSEVGLINYSTLQPIAWDDRQMQSDSSADRTKAYRERMKRHSDVTVTVQEEDTDTDKEEDKKNTKKATGVATPDGVSDSLWTDFKKLRAAKKSPITQTAIDGITREAAKAGLPLPTVLKMCCERGWAGFKADWVADKGFGSQPSANTTEAGSIAAIKTKQMLDERDKGVTVMPAHIREQINKALRKEAA
jgi:hypothetical protein